MMRLKKIVTDYFKEMPIYLSTDYESIFVNFRGVLFEK